MSDSYDMDDATWGAPKIRNVVDDAIRDLDPLKDIASIAVTPASPSIAHPGTQQMVATATMRDGSTRVVTSTVVWASVTTAKATISAAGLVTTVAAGTSVISATLGGVTGSTTATVT